MLGKVYEKISYIKKGEKFEPQFSGEYIINLDRVKKIVTKKSPIEPAGYVTEIEFIGGSIDKVFRCLNASEVTLEQHTSFINSWFLPKHNEK